MALSTCTLTATVYLDGDVVSGTYTATPTLPGSPPGSELTPQSKSGSFTAGALSIALDRAKESDTWPRNGFKYTVVLTVLGRTQSFEVWVDPWDTVIDLGPIYFVRDAVDTDRQFDLAVGESILPRTNLQISSNAASSQELRLTYFTALKTETVTQVRIPCGSIAAAATPTLVRIGIYQESPDGSLTLVANTANDTTLFAATYNEYTKALAAPFKKYKGQRYAVGILVVSAAALPTFLAPHPNNASVLGSVLGRAPRMHGCVTAQADLPSTVANWSITTPAVRLAYAELLP